ncbi:MAG: PspA/IM30 family protein [Deltaproteobacteria bacterium]|nr:PspA/IM30 family protein [Deltaproteobacteria bacterium]
MGVLSRISTLIKSNLNDLISKAEDPEKILEQSIVDMQDNVKEAKKEVIDTLAQQKVLEKKLQTANEEVSAWERKAITAVEGGDDDLAREALRRKSASQSRASALEEQVVVQKDYVDTLRASLTALESKIEEAKSKKTQLVSRLRAAKVKEDMIAAREVAQGTHQALQDDTAFAAFARMEEKILQIEGKVEAMEELSSVSTGADPDIRAELEIEQKLKQLKASSAVEDELDALKKRLAEKNE